MARKQLGAPPLSDTDSTTKLYVDDALEGFAPGGVYAITFGDGAATSYPITHNLSSENITVTIRDVATGEVVYCDVFVTDAETVTLVFDVAPALDSLRCVVFGPVGAGGAPLVSTDITDSTTTGRSVLTAASQAAARTATGSVSLSEVLWDDLPDRPAVVASGADTAAARASISAVELGGDLGTPTSGTLTNCTGLPISSLVASTSIAVGVGTIELGHASDTTISRVSAGKAAVEGIEIVTLTGTQTLPNKTLTSPKMNSILDTNGLLVLTLTGNASAVNSLIITNQAAGSAPQIQATGNDLNVGVNVVPKGSGLFRFNSNQVGTWSKTTLTTSATLSSVSGHRYVVLLDSGAVPTMPTAVSNNSLYTLKNIHTSDITISTTSSQTIEGSSTLVLSAGSSSDVISDGANWRTI